MPGKFSLVEGFPPPIYLKIPAVGLDVSDRSIKYVELARKNGRLRVNKFGSRALAENIIEGGGIKQKDKLIDALSSVGQEIKSKYIVLGLPEEKSFLSRVTLPLIEPGQIRNALELQLEEHVPLSPQEAIFDFEIVGSDAKSIEVYLVAFPLSVVEDYRDVIVAAGFVPSAFETEMQSAIRAMVPLADREEEKINMVVDFGRTRTSIAVAEGDKLRFTSSVKVGGIDLENALVKNLQIKQSEAEIIKKNKGFVRSAENQKAFNSMLPVLSVTKDEIEKYVSYWHTHGECDGGKKNISSLFLCGGDANLYGLADYFSYELKIPARVGNPWVNIVSLEENIPDMELRESLIYTNAIGLALRSWIK